MLALTLQRDAMPMPMGSRLAWLILAGMIIRPRATSSMTKEGGRSSRLATWSISSVSSP